MKHCCSRLLFCLLSCLPVAAFAQWEDALHAISTEEDATDEAWEDTYSMLTALHEHPININQATREDLEQLPFLSEKQVESILEYIYHYGPIKDKAELQMVSSLDMARRRLLEHFIVIGQSEKTPIWPKWNDVAKYGKHSLIATVKAPLYDRKGDRNGYLGYKYKHWFRYQFQYSNRISFGLTGSQDAGEPFFARCNRTGYDYYGYYFQLRNTGRLEALNVGMFRLQWGMGLVMNTGFGLGKVATLPSLSRSNAVIRAHSSRAEAGYFQGIAATVRLQQHWQLTAFASHRPMDATLNSDGSARTIIDNGYHRTPTEIGKKHNLHATAAGASLNWKHSGFFAAADVVMTHFDRALQPQKATAIYRRYAAEGNDFVNAGVCYGFVNTRLSLNGETAMNQQGALATIHSLQFSPARDVTLTLLHRYYDKRYTSLYAHSFSENTQVQNEHGAYVGAVWQPRRTFQVSAYADYAHFAWPRYQVSASSDAFDALLSARYIYKRWSMTGRYRYHLRQRDNAGHTMLINRMEHRGRLSAEYDNGRGLLWRSQFDGVVLSYRQHETGWMAGQQLRYTYRWAQLTASVAYFHTDSYESRLYQYDPHVLYVFSFPLSYGRGLRYSLLLRADIGKRWMLTGRVGTTKYFDRSVISSGLQQINGSQTTDIDLQVRWRY